MASPAAEGYQFWFDHDMLVDGVPSPSNKPADFTFESRKETFGSLRAFGVRSRTYSWVDNALMLGDVAARVVSREDPLHGRTCVSHG